VDLPPSVSPLTHPAGSSISPLTTSPT